MPTLKELRQNYPQYNDMSDQEFSDAFYNKYYSDMNRNEFDKSLGINQPEPNYGRTVGAAALKIPTDIVGTSTAPALNAGGYIGHLYNLATGAEEPNDPEKFKSDQANRVGGDWLSNKFGKAAGLYEPQTDKEKLLDATVRGAGETVLGGGVARSAAPTIAGRIIGNTLSTANNAVLPAAASEYARQKTEGMKFPDWVPGIGGKDISPYVSLATSLFSSVPGQKLVTPTKPGTINPVKQGQYNTAVHESGGTFTPTAGQLTGDKAQINKEWSAGGDRVNQQQQDAIMRQATAATGEPATHITYGRPGDWVDRNHTRTGAQIDRLEQTTNIQPPGNAFGPGGGIRRYADPDLVNMERARPQDANAVLATLNRTANLSPSGLAIPGEQIHSTLYGYSGRRPLTGQQYQELRSNLHSAAEGASSPELAHSYRQTANSLDRMMAQTNPGWKQSWDNARRQYANTLVWKDLAGRAKNAQSQWSANDIAAAQKRVMGKDPWTRGEIENAPFISSAQAFQPLKEHKIPEQYPAYMKMPVVGPILGKASQYTPYLWGPGLAAAAHYGFGLPGELALSGGILGAITGKVAKKVPPVIPPLNPLQQARLKNQLMPAKPGSAAVRALFDSPLFKNQQQNNQ